VAARADCIVSGDADLLSMKSHEGIPILTAAQAAQLLGE
jgi:predicted nucleic acid-binding protein